MILGRSLAVSVVAAALAAGCSIKLLDEEKPSAAVNRCDTDANCGTGATCVSHACFAQTGAIDDIVLEIVRDASSSVPGGGNGTSVLSNLSFISQQSGVAKGDRSRVVQLPKIADISGAVQTAKQLQGCPGQTQSSGAYSIGARVEFARTGELGGVPILGMSTATTSFDTSASATFSYRASLVPGTYDIYVEPNPSCDLAPLLVSGLEIGETIDPKAPPAILTLPEPKTLTARVVRNDPAPSATLSGWTASLIEPQNGRRVSTVYPLGATDTGDHTTNFTLSYQPILSPTQTDVAKASLLVEIAPPSDLVAPMVYWDLSAVDITGSGDIGLDMSGLPTPDALVKVTGTVRGGSSGVPAYLYFDTSKLEQGAGLIANFNPPAIASDAAGHYSVSLYAGEYRVVAVPAPVSGDAAAAVSTASPWAITEERWTVPSTGPFVHDIALETKREVTGTAYVATTGEPARGSVVQADASLDPTQVNVFRAKLGKTPVLPTSASGNVADDGSFSLAIDPGTVDLSVRPPEGADLAFWVRPSLAVSSASVAVRALLAPPVPFEGRVVEADGTSPGSLLITAYAKAPNSAVVTKVGYARTDGGGGFKLRIPASFGP